MCLGSESCANVVCGQVSKCGCGFLSVNKENERWVWFKGDILNVCGLTLSGPLSRTHHAYLKDRCHDSGNFQR